MTRNSGRRILEANRLRVPSGVNLRTSPIESGINSVTTRLPPMSNARPRGYLRPVANVVSIPLGVNFRIASLPPALKKGFCRDEEVAKSIKSYPSRSLLKTECFWPEKDAPYAIRAELCKWLHLIFNPRPRFRVTVNPAERAPGGSSAGDA